MKTHDSPEGQEPPIPAALQERLKALGGPPRVVPANVDDAILGRARQHLSKVAGTRRRMMLPRWLAAAAAVAVCGWLGYGWLSHRPSSFARDDINQDGRVDVLDAFAVARRLQQGPLPGREWDMNRDGVVDRLDIEAIAAEAVKLRKGHG